MVRTRVFFGTLLTVVFVLLVAADAWLSQQTAPDLPGLSGNLAYSVLADFALRGGLLTAVFAFLIGWGVVELGRLCRAAGHQPAVAWSCLATVGLIVIPWLATTPALDNRSPLAEWQHTAQWLALSTIVATVWVMVRQGTPGAIANTGITIWLIVYLGFMGSFEIRLRMDVAGPLGAWLILYHIAVTKFNDVGAYFTGITMGRHPLAPTISPKKTIEGFVGGLVLGIIVSVLLSRLGGIIVTSAPVRLSIAQAIVFGLVIGLVGQTGDLVESMFKRDAQIKDSGSLVPTFGGVLDIIDSPLLTAPIAWWLLTRWMT
jgi:phosphatidate cytidylyltransferase